MVAELRVPVCYSFGELEHVTMHNAVTCGYELKQGQCSRYPGFSATTFSLGRVLGKCHAICVHGVDAIAGALEVE